MKLQNKKLSSKKKQYVQRMINRPNTKMEQNVCVRFSLLKCTGSSVLKGRGRRRCWR